MPAPDEVLVQLVRGRVRDPGDERRQRAPERPQQERAEDRVLRHVRALAQERVPDRRARC